MVIDTAVFERQLFAGGHRGAMLDAHNKARHPGTTLSLQNMLRSLNADIGCTWHCSGNDAFGTLLALQLLLQPENTQIPVIEPVKRTLQGRGLTIKTSFGSGYLTPSSRSPIGASSPLPRQTGAYLGSLETLSPEKSQQGSSHRKSSGRSTPQPQQIEIRSPLLRESALSVTITDANQTNVQEGRTAGHNSKRNSVGPVELFRIGGA